MITCNECRAEIKKSHPEVTVEVKHGRQKYRLTAILDRVKPTRRVKKKWSQRSYRRTLRTFHLCAKCEKKIIKAAVKKIK